MKSCERIMSLTEQIIHFTDLSNLELILQTGILTSNDQKDFKYFSTHEHNLDVLLMTLVGFKQSGNEYYFLSGTDLDGIYLAFDSAILCDYKLYYITPVCTRISDVAYMSPKLKKLIDLYKTNESKFNKKVQKLKVTDKIKNKLLKMNKGDGNDEGYKQHYFEFGKKLSLPQVPIDYTKITDDVIQKIISSRLNSRRNEIGFYEDIDILKYLKKIVTSEKNKEAVEHILGKYNFDHVKVTLGDEEDNCAGDCRHNTTDNYQIGGTAFKSASILNEGHNIFLQKYNKYKYKNENMMQLLDDI